MRDVQFAIKLFVWKLDRLRIFTGFGLVWMAYKNFEMKRKLNESCHWTFKGDTEVVWCYSIYIESLALKFIRDIMREFLLVYLLLFNRYGKVNVRH